MRENGFHRGSNPVETRGNEDASLSSRIHPDFGGWSAAVGRLHAATGKELTDETHFHGIARILPHYFLAHRVARGQQLASLPGSHRAFFLRGHHALLSYRSVTSLSRIRMVFAV
jgi:hypothetical protein